MHAQRRLSPPFARLLYLLLAALLVLGCGLTGGGASPTQVVSTPTDLPTSTSTATLPPPTRTPRPTPTKRPPPTLVPTPAGVGQKVRFGRLEITLVGAATHDLIVPGGLYYYYPKDRTHYFLDLGVLVTDLDEGHTTTVPASGVYVQEENGDAHYPGFADMEIVDRGAKFDPFKIGIATETNQYSEFFIAKDSYLRLVFVIGRDQVILFGIGDSPQIAFKVP
jgi:hypothetical protein